MRKVLFFILISCGISWLIGGAAYLFGLKINTISYILFGCLYMYIPALVAIFLQKNINKEKITKLMIFPFRFNKWLLVAILTPFVLVCLSLLFSLLVPDIHFTTSAEGIVSQYASALPAEQIEQLQVQINKFPPILLFLIFIIQGFLAGCTINAVFAFGEELGWRGYLLYYLRHWSFLKASLLIGFIWGIWHFPLILMGHNYPDHPAIGVFYMIVFCMLLTPIMNYIVIKSGSVISAAIFHGLINAFAGLPVFYLVGGSDLSKGLLGYAGFAAILFITIVFYLYDKYALKENVFSNTIDKGLVDYEG